MNRADLIDEIGSIIMAEISHDRELTQDEIDNLTERIVVSNIVDEAEEDDAVEDDHADEVAEEK